MLFSVNAKTSVKERAILAMVVSLVGFASSKSVDLQSVNEITIKLSDNAIVKGRSVISSKFVFINLNSILLTGFFIWREAVYVEYQTPNFLVTIDQRIVVTIQIVYLW